MGIKQKQKKINSLEVVMYANCMQIKKGYTCN